MEAGGEVREERSGSLAAAILAPVGLAACSSGGEGGKAGSAVAFYGGGAEPPVSPRERGATRGLFWHFLACLFPLMPI
jgi:hypothetical protein